MFNTVETIHDNWCLWIRSIHWISNNTWKSCWYSHGLVWFHIIFFIWNWTKLSDNFHRKLLIHYINVTICKVVEYIRNFDIKDISKFSLEYNPLTKAYNLHDGLHWGDRWYNRLTCTVKCQYSDDLTLLKRNFRWTIVFCRNRPEILFMMQPCAYIRGS